MLIASTDIPVKHSKAVKKRIINNFLRNGYSNHSGKGETLYIIINHCEENHIPYTLQAASGYGYYIKMTPELVKLPTESQQ